MESQIRKLGRHYLSFKPRVLGDYTQRQLSAGAAFTVFAHAEFESFLEDWASSILNRSKARWSTGEIDRCLAYLLAFREKESAPGQVPSGDIWGMPCTQALKAQEDAINKNNGIKENHVCGLFAPIGFDVRKIDQLLLGDMMAFAKLRGDHAHQSYKTHIAQQFDPFDRRVKANNIVTLLKDLDSEFLSYFKMS